MQVMEYTAGKSSVGIFAEIISTARKIFEYRFVVASHVSVNLRLRYRRSVLGFLWTVLAPMMQYMVIGVVFHFATKAKDPSFFVYYFTGSLIFNFFVLSINKAPQVMLFNEHFIKKISLPKVIYVLNSTLLEMTNSLLAAVALMILGLVFGYIEFSWPLLSIPIAFLLYLPAVIGFCSLLAVIGVYFRDFVYIVPTITQALFFLTPILYQKEAMPPSLQAVIQANPFYYMLELARWPLVHQSLAPMQFWAASAAITVVSFLGGLLVIHHFDNRIIFKL